MVKFKKFYFCLGEVKGSIEQWFIGLKVLGLVQCVGMFWGELLG